ncbi:MAG: hypothetical protein ACJ72D_06840 [Marmoricola sp.]
MRRTTTVLALVALLALSTACGAQKVCPPVAGANGIRVAVPPALQRLVGTLRLELCQGRRCSAVTFPTRAPAAGGPLAKGVQLVGGAFQVDLGRFGKGWKASTESGLTIIGSNRKGRIVLQRTEQFTFDATYPKSHGCTPVPALRHSTGVSGADLTG